MGSCTSSAASAGCRPDADPVAIDTALARTACCAARARRACASRDRSVRGRDPRANQRSRSRAARLAGNVVAAYGRGPGPGARTSRPRDLDRDDLAEIGTPGPGPRPVVVRGRSGRPDTDKAGASTTPSRRSGAARLRRLDRQYVARRVWRARRFGGRPRSAPPLTTAERAGRGGRGGRMAPFTVGQARDEKGRFGVRAAITT
jgi:hypothetical protein